VDQTAPTSRLLAAAGTTTQQESYIGWWGPASYDASKGSAPLSRFQTCLRCFGSHEGACRRRGERLGHGREAPRLCNSNHCRPHGASTPLHAGGSRHDDPSLSITATVQRVSWTAGAGMPRRGALKPFLRPLMVLSWWTRWAVHSFSFPGAAGIQASPLGLQSQGISLDSDLSGPWRRRCAAGGRPSRPMMTPSPWCSSPLPPAKGAWSARAPTRSG
jgi:hypothetical protein